MSASRRTILAGLAATVATSALAITPAQRLVLSSGRSPLGLPKGAFGIWPFDLLSGGKVPNLVSSSSPIVTGGSLASGALTGNGNITFPSSRGMPIGYTVSCLVQVTAINVYNMILYNTADYNVFAFHSVSSFTGNGGGPVNTRSLGNFTVGIAAATQNQYGGFTNLVGKGYHVLTYRQTSAGECSIWLDDIKLYINQTNPGSLTLGAALKFGISPEPVQSAQKYAGFLGFWDRGLTDAEVRQVVEKQRSYAARSGIAISDSSDRILIAEGDSNHGAFDHNCWIWQFAPNDSPEAQGGSYAIGGSTVVSMAARAFLVDQIIPPAGTGGRKFIMTVGIGTNDLTGYDSTTVNTVFIPLVRAYMMARKAAGWSLALFTVPYRGDLAGASATNFETVRAIFNADIVANPTLYGLASGGQVIDIGSANGIGSGGIDLTKYVSPYLHFSATGGAQIEALARPIINAL